MSARIDRLTDKEKEALRLIVRGHDTKSAASALDLSVHAINDRLRSARRKLETTSSKEAARLLLKAETETPEKFVHESPGDAAGPIPSEDNSAAPSGLPRKRKIGGFVAMLLVAATLALGWAAAPETRAPAEPQSAKPSAAVLDALEPQARTWLAHIDGQEWQAGHAASATSLQEFIAPGEFGRAMARLRAPLGRIVERRFDSFGSLSLGPSTYRLVHFETDFADRRKVRETVIFGAENGAAKVSGYWIGEDADTVGYGTPIMAREGSGQDAQSSVGVEVKDAADAIEAAQAWLADVDDFDWAASFARAGASFRAVNTVAGWADASRQVRVPLGRMVSREVTHIHDVAAPPAGYREVIFATRFESGGSQRERVTLEREGEAWRVVGYLIE